MRLVFLCSGSGSLLARVIARYADDPEVTFAGYVVDRDDIPPAALARERGIPLAVVPRPKGMSPDDYGNLVADAVREWRPDWLMMTFDHLLRGAILTEHRHRLINTHYALLPAFAGVRPVRRALASSARVAGVTVHLIDETVDLGPPLIQAVAPILDEDDEAALQNRLFHLAVPLAIQVVAWARDDRIHVDDGDDGPRVRIDGVCDDAVPVNPHPDDAADLLSVQEPLA